MYGSIKHIKGDLFSVPSGVLAHACNCYGAWGGGIAHVFKQKFPKAYKEYNQYCASRSPAELLGTCQLIDSGNYKIACLFTNDNSSHEEIAEYTRQAVQDLASQIPEGTTINMPQINAGIWGVPWHITEGALKQVDVPIAVYVLG